MHAQLTLPAARAAAHRSSPEIVAAREAVTAAAARERQAGALPNPTLAYGREQTSRSGQTNAQDIVQLEQALEIGGQRAARRDVARARREVAEARLALVRRQLDHDVARAFVLAIAAERRSQLAEQTTAAFAEAQRVSERRLAAGDVAGYVTRRLKLEAARFAAVRATIAMERHAARVALASLVGLAPSNADTLTLPLDFPADWAPRAGATLDSLAAQSRARIELRIATLDAMSAVAEARLALRERTPTPTFTAGYKGERVADPGAGSLTGFRGITAGFSIPLPVFDRREGAIAAADADTRRVTAEGDALRRRILREVSDAHDALQAAEAQQAALAPHVGDDARVAVRAVQASYAEGEITLVEWLDAIRAYQEAELTNVMLQAEVAVRRVELARAVGQPLFTSDPDPR